MLDLTNLESKLGPTGTKAVMAILGGAAAHIWDRIRARRTTLSWTANFQKISPQGTDPFSTQVQIQVNGKPAQNVYSCQITVLNESAHDVDEFDLLFTFQNSFIIQHSTGSISASAKRLMFSPAFQKPVDEIKALADAERAKHVSFRFLLENREFHLPSLNRGTSATFTFLITSQTADKEARVLVTSEKKGIRLVSRPAQPTLAGVRFVESVFFGILITPLFVLLLPGLNLSPLKTAFSGFALGIFAGLFGIIFVKIWRLIRNLFG